MSLILDALNKADREREYRDAVPDLQTVHGAIRPARDRRLMWVVGSLIAALVMLTALLLVLWLRSAPVVAPSERDPQPAESVPAPQVAAPVAVPSEPQASPAPAQNALAAAQSPLGNAQSPMANAQSPMATAQSAMATAQSPVAPAQSSSEAAQSPLSTAEAAAIPAPSVDTEVQALYQTQLDSQVIQVVEPQIQPALPQPTVITPENPRQSTVDEALARALWEESQREMRQPVPASALPPSAQPLPARPTQSEPQPLPADLPAEETLAGHTDVPYLHELPVSTQNTIPTLMYAKHEYDKGFVVINKEELQVGSAAQGGVLLERILADGVLLSLNGTQFKLSSLSSWVNY